MAKKAKVSRKAKSGGPTEVGFEDAIADVEGIIERIESGEIGLEESVEAYERGAALLKRCREILERSEQRVETVTKELERREKTRGAGA